MREHSINALVRPILTLMFAGVFCYLAVTKTINAETFVGTSTLVITWWFKARDESKKV